MFTYSAHTGLMRYCPFVLPALLLACSPMISGCGVDAAAETAGVAVGSVALFQRSPVDMVVSAVSGRDCSVVNLDEKQTYCRPKEAAPEAREFCTRSLGVADCWKDPSALPDRPQELGDGPSALTKAQDADRTRRWPGLW